MQILTVISTVAGFTTHFSTVFTGPKGLTRPRRLAGSLGSRAIVLRMRRPITGKVLKTPNPHSPALSSIAASARGVGRTSSVTLLPGTARIPPSSNALRSDASITEKAMASSGRTSSRRTVEICTKGGMYLARPPEQSCQLQLPSTPRHKDLAALVRTDPRSFLDYQDGRGRVEMSESSVWMIEHHTLLALHILFFSVSHSPMSFPRRDRKDTEKVGFLSTRSFEDDGCRV